MIQFRTFEDPFVVNMATEFEVYIHQDYPKVLIERSTWIYLLANNDSTKCRHSVDLFFANYPITIVASFNARLDFLLLESKGRKKTVANVTTRCLADASFFELMASGRPEECVSTCASCLY